MAELQAEGPVASDAPAELGKDGATVDVRVPMGFRRRGGRKEIILPPDANTTPDAGPRRPIVVALARAYKWQEMLDSGEVSSLNELAGLYGVDRSYVGRIAKLATLAPDVVDALLKGKGPSGLSLGKVKGSPSVRWDEQRRLLRLHSGL